MEFLVLDDSFIDVGFVDKSESKLWVDRYSAYGDFEVFTPFNYDILRLLEQDYYLWNRDSDHMMIVEEREITTDSEEGDKIRVTGRSLESILDRRIIWSQTIINGNFQNGIQRLLNENIISPSDTMRRIPNFIFQASTDPRITAITVRAQFTGDNLYSAIKALCDAASLGFKIILDSANRFVFSLYMGQDRSYQQFVNPYVVFSPGFDNILNSNYFESQTNLRTIALVAGEGEGHDRKTVTVGAGLSGLNRREQYVDARDISSNVESGTLPDSEYNALLTQRGIEKLAENIFITSFEGEVAATQMYIFGRDFFMGDIVQITNEYGLEARSRVSEIIMSQSTDGYYQIPTFIAV